MKFLKQSRKFPIYSVLKFCVESPFDLLPFGIGFEKLKMSSESFKMKGGICSGIYFVKRIFKVV